MIGSTTGAGATSGTNVAGAGITGVTCGAASSTNATGSSATGKVSHGSAAGVSGSSAATGASGSGSGSTGCNTGSASGRTIGAGSSSFTGAGAGAGSGIAGGCSTTGSCGFLRSHPNRLFFSPAAAGVFLSSLEPNMEDGYLTVATRHKGAPANKYSMQNRLCFIQLVHAQHFVEAPQAPQRSINTKDWNGIVGENAEFS